MLSTVDDDMRVLRDPGVRWPALRRVVSSDRTGGQKSPTPADGGDAELT